MNKLFKFKIANAGSSATDRKIAIFPGPFFRLNATNTITLGSSSSEVYATAVSTAFDVGDDTYIDYAGFAVDACLDDGTFLGASSTNNDVVGTAINSKHKIRTFQEWIRYNPQILRAMTIRADNKEVYDEDLSICQYSSLYDAPVETISLQEYFNAFQNQDSKIVLQDLKWYVGPNTIWTLTIPDGRTVNFELYFA